MQDSQNTGMVSKQLFERVIHETKVHLSNEDLGYLYQQCSADLSTVDYAKLS